MWIARVASVARRYVPGPFGRVADWTQAVELEPDPDTPDGREARAMLRAARKDADRVVEGLSNLGGLVARHLPDLAKDLRVLLQPGEYESRQEDLAADLKDVYQHALPEAARDRGLACPTCGNRKWRVVGGKAVPGGKCRRRECLECGYRLYTLERAVGDGAREQPADGVGLVCPACGNRDWRGSVEYTRPGRGHVQRRRECPACGHRMTTAERILRKQPKDRPPADIRTIAALCKDIHVSQGTVRRAVKDGRLCDYREPDKKGTPSPCMVSLAEAERYWPKQKNP